MSRIDDNSPDKVYVDVIDYIDDCGKHTPLYFKWLDDKRYKIDKVIKRDNQCSLKAGGVGIRYTVMVQGRETHIWQEDNCWFMERQ